MNDNGILKHTGINFKGFLYNINFFNPLHFNASLNLVIKKKQLSISNSLIQCIAVSITKLTIQGHTFIVEHNFTTLSQHNIYK